MLGVGSKVRCKSHTLPLDTPKCQIGKEYVIESIIPCQQHNLLCLEGVHPFETIHKKKIFTVRGQFEHDFEEIRELLDN